MLTSLRKQTFTSRSGLILSCFALFAATTLAGANRAPTKRITFDPDAKQVELFEAMEDGTLSVRMIPKNSEGGNVFFENKSDQPITVKLPEAIVGVHVLKQFGGQQGFGQQGGLGGGLAGGGLGGQGGQGQQLGGGFGGGGGLGGGGFGGGLGGGGNGFFSIPPERIVQVPFQSVCLAHGKPDPRPRMTYEVVPVESFTTDPNLQEALKIFGPSNLNQRAMQAAAWHLSDGLSWQELAAKEVRRIGGPNSPYFSRAQLLLAQQIVNAAEVRARERKDENPRTEKVEKKI